MTGRLFTLVFLLFISVPLRAQQVSPDYVADEVIVVSRRMLLWDQRNKTVAELMAYFPAGSRITGCADMPVLEQPAVTAGTGRFFGTQFLVKLPGALALQIVSDSDRLQESMIVRKVMVNRLLQTFSSNPISINDPNYLSTNGLYYNPAFISGGGKYCGQQHAYGYVPSNCAKVLATVVDVGLNFNHQDAVNAYWVNPGETGLDANNNPKQSNGIDDDMDGYVDDWRGWDFGSGDNNPSDSVGHGTGVFGIMAARIDNGLNTAGVIGDSATTMVLNANFPVGAQTVTDFASTSAYYYAISRNAKVVNMSFGSTSANLLLEGAIQMGVSQRQVVPVAAAGNAGNQQLFYPASYANVISVGAVQSNGINCGFSSYGDSLDIMHLGCYMYPSLSATDNTSTIVFMGTSAASPGIAGFCWWLKKIDTSFTVQQVTQMIRSCGSNHGTFNILNGYGTFTRFDSLLRKLLLPDTVITLNACSGMQPLPHSRYFKLADSAWYGHPAMTGDSINTNYLAPGAYTGYFAWKSEPRPNTYYYDTIAFKIIVNGTGGIAPVTSVSTPSTTVCSGATYVISSSGNTTNADKSWYRNGSYVGTGNTWTDTMNTVGSYSYFAIADMASIPGCWQKRYDTSNTVTVTGQTGATPGISISGPASICLTSGAAFQAAVTNAGSNPVYQWRINGQPAGTNSSTFSPTVLANGDIITCRVASSSPCNLGDTAVSNSLMPLVNTGLIPSVAINTASTTVCTGVSVTFTATCSNAGSSPVYQWQVNGVNQGSNSNSFTYIPANNDVVTCLLTPSAGGCYALSSCTSNNLTMTVSSVITPMVTVSPASLSLCESGSATLIATGNAPNATYQWYQGITPVGTGGSLPLSGMTAGSYNYSVVMTLSSGGCYTLGQATSNTVPVTVQAPAVPVTTAAASSYQLCEPGQDTLSAVCSVPGAGWQWQQNGADIPGATGASYPASGLPAGSYAFRCITSMPAGGCFTRPYDTSNALQVNVSSSLVPDATLSYLGPSEQDSLYYTLVTNYTYYAVRWFRNGLLAAQTAGNAWACKTQAGATDTVYAIAYNLSGCYTSDSVITNSIIIQGPSSVGGSPVSAGFSLLPNPFSTQLTVTGLSRGDRMLLMDATGRKVREWTMSEQQRETVSIPDVAAGVYLVRVVTKTGTTEVIRLIKSH